MTKHMLILLILTACSTFSNHPMSDKENPDEDLVTVHTALDQAQASYLRGCVDGSNGTGKAPVFEVCRELSKAHRTELNQIMGVKGSSSSTDQPKK